MNLTFNGTAGSNTASSFGGTQQAGTNSGPIAGTFTYQ
jgi:hypothetical protein